MSFEALVNQARTGDRNAVGILIDRYRKYLLFIANNDLDQNLQAKMGASDAVQESMMHAHFHFDQFRGNTEGEWKAWLKTILANDIRKGKRQYFAQKRDANREVSVQPNTATGQDFLDGKLTPSSEAIEREKAMAVEIAMSQLTDQQRQVIQMRNFERLSFSEIGSRTRRSEDAARKLWARSIEALKNAMKSCAPELMDESRYSGPRDD